MIDVKEVEMSVVHKVNLGDLEQVTACGFQFDDLRKISSSWLWAGVTCEECLATRTGFGGEDWSPQGVARDQLRERLAKFLHEDIWSHWMKYLWGCCEHIKCESEDVGPGDVVIPVDKAQRWRCQMKTPYEKLTKKEKASDLQLADKLLKVLEEKPNE